MAIASLCQERAGAGDGQPGTLQAEVFLPFPVILPIISRKKLLLHIMGCKLVIVGRKTELLQAHSLCDVLTKSNS